MLSHGMAMACNKSYRDMIIADGAAYFWDFMDQPNATAAPAVGGVALNVFGAPPAQQFTQDTKALVLNGTSQAAGQSSISIGATNYSLEVWMKTASKYGGPIGCSNTGNTSDPTNYDKMCYITSSGNMVFGVYNAAQRSLDTGKFVCDNVFHHILLSFDTSSSKIYIDGQLAGTLGYVSTDSLEHPVFGYTHAATWPGYVSPFLNGFIACPAIYKFAAPADMAMRHYLAGL